MLNKKKNILAAVLSCALLASSVMPSYVSAGNITAPGTEEDSSVSDDSAVEAMTGAANESVAAGSSEDAADEQEVSAVSVLSAYLQVPDEAGKFVDDEDVRVELAKDNAFYGTDSVLMRRTDENAMGDIESVLDKETELLPYGYTAADAFDIAVYSEDGQEIEPDGDGATEVTLFLPEEDIEALDGTMLLHIMDDGAEQVEYELHDVLDDDGEKTGEQCFVFETESFSPFVFVTPDEEEITAEETDESVKNGDKNTGEDVPEIVINEDNESDEETVTDKTKSEESADKDPVAKESGNSSDETVTEEPETEYEDEKGTVLESESKIDSKNTEIPDAGLLENETETDPVTDGTLEEDVTLNAAQGTEALLAADEEDSTEDSTAASAQSLLDSLKGLFNTNNAGTITLDDPDNEVHITDFSARLFYGAAQQEDTTDAEGNVTQLNYLWNVPANSNGGAAPAGHHINYRITFATSGTGEAEAEAIKIRVPASTIIDRDGNAADTVEWSIPSKADIEAAKVYTTDDEGNTTWTIDPDEIDDDIDYAYYYDEDADEYVIYNFREVSAADNGYIEMSYVTAKSSFSYVDQGKMKPFTATMTVGEESRATTPIVVKFDTTAAVTSTYKYYLTSNRIKNWDSSWGDGVKPENPEGYYYIVWYVRSHVTATQPYSFSLADTLDSNLGGMEVLGIRYSGESTFTSPYESDGVTPRTKTMQTATNYRYDYVLTAIPLSVYEDEGIWRADNTAKVTVTPSDMVDSVTSKSASATWTWTRPVFSEPAGSFNAFKRADGAYRANNSWGHYSNSLDFRAGYYSRYDLEEFDGYNDTEITHTDTYGGFDYASWIIGYPLPWTQDTSAVENYSEDEPWTAYGKKPVMYELVDEGIYLLNDEAAILSSNGSSNRTIENGGLSSDTSKAILLTNADFRIDKIQYSWYMRDADYDGVETGAWVTKAADCTDNDTLVFYGKFDGSDTWTKIGTYNINTGIANMDSSYVSSSSTPGREIVFADGKDCTAYKVTAANSHYVTELFTVPFVSLKNTGNIQAFLNKAKNIAIVNNNHGYVYSLADGVNYAGTAYTTLMETADNWNQISEYHKSDTDYAVASQKDSGLKKTVVSSSNNVKKRYYTVTWKLAEYETLTGGESGTKTSIPQEGGIFYDLLPEGALYQPGTVTVNNGSISDSGYTVKTISNYKGSGRTMLVINISQAASSYTVTFDTRYTWNSIKDYGATAMNPAAYETGNDSIYGGSADDGGSFSDDSVKTWMADLATGAGTSTEDDDDDITAKKFLYGSYEVKYSTLTAASSGLTKQVLADGDKAYSYATETKISGTYSYKLRFLNSNDTDAKDLVFYDVLESYDNNNDADTTTTDSDWTGMLTGIDVSQLTEKGAKADVYISTNKNMDFSDGTGNENRALTNTSVWTKVDDLTDKETLKDAKAVAIDLRKKADGTNFQLGSGDSVVAILYMEAPDEAPDTPDGQDYPYAYNQIWISDTVMADAEDVDSQDESFVIRQAYTSIGLKVTGNVVLSKTNSHTGNAASGITFRLYGTSDYNTAVDMTAVSRSDGSVVFSDIEKGTYTLQETDATDDYLLNPAEHTVVITGEGKAIIDPEYTEDAEGKRTMVDGSGTDATDTPYGITNDPRVHTDISFIKADSLATSTLLPGAVYRLSGTSDYNTDVLMTATTAEGGENGNDRGIATFSNVEKGTYTLKEVTAPEGYILDSTEYTVKVDGDGNYTINGEERDIYTGVPTTAYSYTQNLSEDGTQNSNYGNSWSNSNIRGTGRESASSQAHVVTIDGAETLHVKLTWGGESASYDYVCVWEGSYPSYTANGNGSSGIRFNTSNSSYPYRGGGGSHTAAANTVEFDVEGDTVTFSFRSDGSGVGDGYGYYAVVTDADYKVTGTTTELEKDSSGTYYQLTDEPQHYITFTKKSSYDQSVVGGATFTLSGTSDGGNAVSSTAASDDTTGTVRFDGLESGTYTLTETQAPEGYAENSQKYVVRVNKDSTYTISGLTQTGGIYDLYNTKTRSETVTVTKVWDDGVTTHVPSDLAVTITTKVPAAANRTYSIKFDANGGTFGNSDLNANGNTLTYNAKNEITSGTYYEPQASDSENYQFAGWSTSKTASNKDSSITLTPNGLSNTYLNGRTADSVTTLYAVYTQKPYIYYAVSVYGIGTDTVSRDGGQTTETAGLTFGPATGNMFSNYTNYGSLSNGTISGKYLPMMNAHAVSNETYLINDNSITTAATTTATTDQTATDSSGNYAADGATAPAGRTTVTAAMMQADMDAVQAESETAITDSTRNVIVGDDAGKDDAGNAYRCIHYDNWNTILYWNSHDPHVYDKCVSNRCSKRLVLRGVGTYISWLSSTSSYYKLDNGVVRGDGASIIGISVWDRTYNSSVDADDMYSASNIREKLVGSDKLINPNTSYVTGGISESQSAFMALPEKIRNQVGAKALYDTYGYSKRTTNTAGPYYDNLWLFDGNEIFNTSSNSAGSSVYSQRAASSYGSRGSLCWWWLRSRGGYYGAWGVNNNGGSNNIGVGSSRGVAPGFSLCVSGGVSP